ncbi:MAG: class I SAM-dependent methyltransferase [Chthoniobacterales bacterium]
MSDPKIEAAFARHAPWVTRFRIGDHNYGGTFDAPNDSRLDLFWRAFPKARRILELGSLEGGHTLGLAQRPEVEHVLGIEGRGANLARARAVQKILQVEKIDFVQGNLEQIDLAQFGRFDAIYCSGLLYHLPEPWRLVSQFRDVAENVFLWTHCSSEANAESLANGYRGQRFKEGGPDEVLSGLSPDSFWPSLGSLCNMLTTSGFSRLHLLDSQPDHPNGPAVTIAAYS